MQDKKETKTTLREIGNRVRESFTLHVASRA